MPQEKAATSPISAYTKLCSSEYTNSKLRDDMLVAEETIRLSPKRDASLVRSLWQSLPCLGLSVREARAIATSTNSE